MHLAGLSNQPPYWVVHLVPAKRKSPLDLIASTDRGLYCAAGDFHIDPWRPVPRAIITHAHSDHARFGSEVYVCHRDTAPILRKRLGDVAIETATYGEILTRNGVELSFHPAGHVLGSAQVRVALNGETWVASGDYKLESDGVSPAFEPIRCHAFITESTFGLPIYRWRPQAEMFAAIDAWRRENIAAGRASILFAYALGKAQRRARACRPGAWADRLSRRGRGDQRALSRGRRRAAADASCDGDRRTSAISPAPSSSRRPPPPRARGSSASATIPTRSRAAGCRCGETAAGAGSTAALRCPTTPTGRASSPPSRRRAPSAFS